MLNILILLLIGYGCLLAGLYLFQRKLMYHPDPDQPIPAQYRLFETVKINVPSHDDLDLLSWYQAPKAPENRVILYFHGNAGSLGGRSDKAARFIDQGFGFLFPSYRYNAGIGGDPSEQALIQDGKYALEWLLNQGYETDQIILYGESLGSGVAVALATEYQVNAVILEAPYSSVADVAQGIYWFMPVQWLVHDKFDSVARVTDTNSPILIVHGTQDRTIPIRYGRKLHQATQGKSEFVAIEGAGHADLYDYGMAPHLFRFLSTQQ